MDTREFEGLELAAKAKIEHRKTYWYVPSASAVGGHRVENDGSACSCDDFELRQLPCKHIFAVRFVKERNRGKPIPERNEDVAGDTPPTKRPTYRQNWPAYNAAQTSEKRHFLPLLAELCATVPDRPTKPVGGRPRVRERDALFAAMFKVYSGFSGRRFTTDLQDAQEVGYVERAPHYNSVFRVFEDAAVTPVLRELVARSSLPLRGVEINFAIDSSGFSTSRYERWFDTKYGVDRKRATWVKAHLCVGVETQVVASVEIGDAHDSQMLPDLLRVAAKNFPVRDVLADKAYLSLENVEFIADEGGTAHMHVLSWTSWDAHGSEVFTSTIRHSPSITAIRFGVPPSVATAPGSENLFWSPTLTVYPSPSNSTRWAVANLVCLIWCSEPT